jgi:hypothetical protein
VINSVKDNFRRCWRNYPSRHYPFSMLDMIKTSFKNSLQDVVIFCICLMMYGLNELFFKKIAIPFQSFFTGYFNDLLAPIFLLSYTNILLKIFLKKIYLNFIVLSIFILTVGCFWEFITPFYKNSTSDLNDLITYYIGFLLYWFFRRLYLP